MSQRRSTPPRASAQISVGRRLGPQPPLGSMRTIDQAAEILNISSRTIRRLIDSGNLPVHRFGRSVRISDLDVAQLIAASRDE